MKNYKIPVMVAVLVAGTCFGAVECVWIGGVSGEFSVAENWDPAVVPNTAENIAVFTNAASVSSDSDFVELHVRAGDLVFSKTGRFWFTSGNSAGEVVVNVAGGSTVDLRATDNNIVYGHMSLTFVKAGDGVLRVARELGREYGSSDPRKYYFKDFDIRGGTLHMEANYGGLYTYDGYVRIRSGATFEQRRYAQFPEAPLVEIDEGGVLDLGNVATTLRALLGKGSVINAAGKVTLSLADGPFRYGGVFPFGADIVLAPTGYVAGNTKLVLENPHALSNAVPTVSGDGLTLSDVLSFKDGVGVVTVADESAFGLVSESGNRLLFKMEEQNDYVHEAAGDDDWSDVAFTAHGDVTEKSAGTWTVGSLTMDAGRTFEVSADAAGHAIHLKGGVMTNIVFLANATDYAYCFDGVELMTSHAMSAANGRIYRQTAGDVCLGGLTANQRNTELFSTNEVFYCISGGTLSLRPDDYYQYGLGLEASGTADVTLGTGTFGAISLSYETHGYTLRIKDDATVRVDNLNFYYYKGGATTSRVEVIGNGVLEVSGKFGSTGDYLPENSSYRNYLTFDGGTIRSTSTMDSSIWPNVGGGEETQVFSSMVKLGGMTVDVPSDFGRMHMLRWNGPLLNDVTDGHDGGLTKTGYGALSLLCTNGLRGPIIVEKGVLSGQCAGTGAMGTGSIVLDAAMLQLDSAGDDVSIASSRSSTVKFKGNSIIHLAKKGMLKIGAEGRVDTPFARGERGFLAFYNSRSDFKAGRVRVYGGLAPSLSGVSSLPVFGWVTGQPDDSYGHNRGSYDVRLLSCDADGFLNFPSAASTNAIPEDASVATVIYQHDGMPLTVSRNVHVGAMEIFGGMYSAASCIGGLVIEDGVTLTVGAGAGTLAPVAINNLMSADVRYGNVRLVGGGTLDFADSAGVFALNSTYTTGMPAVVSCRLAGSSGIVFYSPCAVNLNDTGNIGNDNLSQRFVRAVSVTGDNIYSGGTYVDNVVVIPGRPTSLGTGTVMLSGERYRGGELHFDGNYVGTSFTNSVEVSGTGFYFAGVAGEYADFWGVRAAISSHDKRISFTGTVRLAGDATVATSGAKGRITFEGPVEGTGTLRVTAGKVIVKKKALLAYEAGRIIAEDGAVLTAKYPVGFTVVVY
jgi:hypothetical protein